MRHPPRGLYSSVILLVHILFWAALGTAQEDPAALTQTDEPEQVRNAQENEDTGATDTEVRPVDFAVRDGEGEADRWVVSQNSEEDAFRWSSTLIVVGLIGVTGTLGIEFYLANEFDLLERLSKCEPKYREAECPGDYVETKENISNLQTAGIISLGLGTTLFLVGTALYAAEIYDTPSGAQESENGSGWKANLSPKGMDFTWFYVW